MRQLRFHVTSLPHTRVSKEFSACAYTAKIRNFCVMMKALGHHVILYAPEGSDATICNEFVETTATVEQEDWFGHGHDWQKKGFNIAWSELLDYWKVTNLRAAAEIVRRSKKGDMVCIVGGSCQKPLADQLDQSKVAVVEPFIGYQGVFARFQVYESYTHQAMNASRGNMAKVYQQLCQLGAQGFNPEKIREILFQSADPNGDNYHDVVPVYFDPDDFPEGDGKGCEIDGKRYENYYLYVGRLISRKGIQVAENTVKAMGAKLLIVGQGVKEWDAEKHRLVTDEGNYSMTFEGPHIEYLGFADVEKRAKLMGGAIACFTPTQYFEPGGNTSVEPQACGTPVLATNFGCFEQQVINGVTGYRPTTLQEWMICANACKTLDRSVIRTIAHQRHSLKSVAPLFDQYFQRVYDLQTGAGWNTIDPGREKFSWF